MTIRKIYFVKCPNCFKDVKVEGKNKNNDVPFFRSLQNYNNTGRAYCCQECATEYKKKLLKESTTKYFEKNRDNPDFWKKRKNPMRNKKSRELISLKCKLSGRKPTELKKGEKPKAQKVLYDTLIKYYPRGWEYEYSIKFSDKEKLETNKRGYRIDIANPLAKIAIEVDGTTHFTDEGKIKDKEKNAFLLANKWSIIRFRNDIVLKRPEECVSKIIKFIKDKGKCII